MLNAADNESRAVNSSCSSGFCYVYISKVLTFKMEVSDSQKKKKKGKKSRALGRKIIIMSTNADRVEFQGLFFRLVGLFKRVHLQNNVIACLILIF